MNNLSPRVVSIPRTPLRGTSGNLIARIVKVISVTAIIPKKAAVGQVQAIHSIFSLPFRFLHATQGKTLGDVVADKVDNQSTGYDRQDTCGR